MSASWRALASQLGHDVLDAEIVFNLPTKRQQRVFIDEQSDRDVLRLWSVILGPGATSELSDGSSLEYAWERNRLSDLIGFSVDIRGRLIGETWLPKFALDRTIFDIHLSELARVCDWHELRLSGADAY